MKKNTNSKNKVSDGGGGDITITTTKTTTPSSNSIYKDNTALDENAKYGYNKNNDEESTNNGVNNANSNTNVSTNKGANTEITEFPVIIRTSWSAVMRSLLPLSIWFLFHPLDQNTPTLTRNYFLWLLSNNRRSLMLINAEINPGELWLY